MKMGIEIHIVPNNNTLDSEIFCNCEINVRKADSTGHLLGFKPQIFKANKVHQSDSPVSIIRVKSLRIECNVTTGAYINDRKVNPIHEFIPFVLPGYKKVEVPSHVIYLPVAVKTIDQIQLRIVDQDGNLLNFRGETITLRLHIKSL